jgi:hypothetical protein
MLQRPGKGRFMVVHGSKDQKEVYNEMQLLGAREGVEEGVQATWNSRAEGRGC